MSEVITVQDLETLKKHEIFEAEVITGKTGGVAGGAYLAAATNPVTGQSQETLPQILSDLGMQVQPWSSSIGGVLITAAQIFLNDTPGSLGIGEYYAWGGPFPKTVPAGTDPALPGSGYILRSNKFVKSMVLESLRRSYAEAGYSVVGTFQAGFTYVNPTDVGIDEATGRGYTGGAGVVPPGTNPTGGGFTDKSSEMLRTSVLKVTRSYPIDVTDYLPAGYVTDGSVDYIHIIQQVFDLAAGVRPVLMPNFHVLVDPARAGFAFAGVLVPSNSHIIFQQNSKLLTKPNSLDSYEILSMRDVVNVTIHRPFIVGDKYTHTGTTGEFGMGIAIRGACKNINITDPETNEFWGDGIYIGQIASTVESTPENVTITRPIGRLNRRQGMSITSANGLTVIDPQWWDTKSSDCPTPLPAGPHAGVDIEPNSVNSLLRNIVFRGVRGGGNDGGLFYTYLGAIVTTAGNRYHIDINVDSITDSNSRHAFVNMGLNKDSLYSGAIDVGQIISNIPFWNGIRHRNMPEQCGLQVNIGYASINNWQSLTTAPARYRSPVVIEYDGAEVGFPTLGNLHIGKLDLNTTVAAGSLSDNAVFVGVAVGGSTIASPATRNVNINFGAVKATKSLRIEGLLSGEVGLNNRFGSQLKFVYGGSTNFLPGIFADKSIESPGGSATITLPSTYPSDLEGNSIRFRFVLTGTSTLARLRSLTVPMYLNGVVATNITFTESAGLVTLTFRGGIYFVKAEGPIIKES